MWTKTEYFDRYKYCGGRSLSFAQGGPIVDLFNAVIGADVAEKLGYAIGDPIVVAQGVASFSEHSDTPFQVAGVMEKTGTPVDRAGERYTIGTYLRAQPFEVALKQPRFVAVHIGCPARLAMGSALVHFADIGKDFTVISIDRQ